MPLSKTHINLMVAIAIMSSQHCAVATESHHQLSSTTISEIPQNELGPNSIFDIKEGEKHVFSTSDKAHYTIFNNNNEVNEISFINAFNSNLAFKDHFDLTIDAFNVEDRLFGVFLDNQNQTSFGDSFSLSTTAHNGDSTALSMLESQLSFKDTNAQLNFISRTITTDDRDNQAIAIELSSSLLDIHSNTQIKAFKQINNTTSPGTAIRLFEQSHLIFKSAGNSLLIGDIESDETSHIDLQLTGNHDFWIGNIRTTNANENTSHNDSKYINGNSSLSITNGASWAPLKDNGYKNLFWGKNSVIDLSYTDQKVRLGLPSSEHNDSHITSCTQIEDGAILRVRITDDYVNHELGIGKEAYLLNVENAQAFGNENIQITVNVIDDRTQKNSSTPLEIELIHFDKVTGGITLKSDTYEYETGLGKFQTLTEFGSGISGGFVINDIRTDLIGPSALTNNHLDFTSTEMIALERLGNLQLNALTDRALFKKQKGLWTEAHYGQVQTHFDNNRKHTIKTASLIMGYDRDVVLPYMNDTFAGTLVYFSQNDIDLVEGSAESNAYGFGVYAGGLSTEKKYRLMMQAYIGQTDSKLSSAGFINGQAHTLDFNNKAKHYGVGLYLGFVQAQHDASPWFWEPFIAGQSYWIKGYKTNEVQGLSFEKAENHQSVVKLGTTVAYQCPSNTSNAIYTQLAWIHRFGKSINVVGNEGSQTMSFHSPDLQESWGEMSIGANWSLNNHWDLHFKTTMGYAQNVKPNYDLNASVTYAF